MFHFFFFFFFFSFFLFFFGGGGGGQWSRGFAIIICMNNCIIIAVLFHVFKLWFVQFTFVQSYIFYVILDLFDQMQL